MQQLPDYLDSDLEVLSIGSNPSPYSIKVQCYYGNPQNRFWKALNASQLVSEELVQETASMEVLLNKYRIGFTDVVKPPTPGVAQLRAKDYREWAPVLKEKILRYQPRVCWFHGKVAYQNFLKYTEGVNEPIEWGLQPVKIGRSVVFVSPNPSPANAVYSLPDLVDWFNRLKQLLDTHHKED